MLCTLKLLKTLTVFTGIYRMYNDMYIDSQNHLQAVKMTYEMNHQRRNFILYSDDAHLPCFPTQHRDESNYLLLDPSSFPTIRHHPFFEFSEHNEHSYNEYNREEKCIVDIHYYKNYKKDNEDEDDDDDCPRVKPTHPAPHPTTSTHPSTPHPTSSSHPSTPHPTSSSHSSTPHPTTSTHSSTPHPTTSTHSSTPHPTSSSHSSTPHPTSSSHPSTPHPTTSSHSSTPHPTTSSHSSTPHPTTSTQPSTPEPPHPSTRPIIPVYKPIVKNDTISVKNVTNMTIANNDTDIILDDLVDYLGCIKSPKHVHYNIWPQSVTTSYDDSNITIIEACANSCQDLSEDNRYIGIDSGTECICGSRLPTIENKRIACLACRDTDSYTCGNVNYGFVSVYKLKNIIKKPTKKPFLMWKFL